MWCMVSGLEFIGFRSRIYDLGFRIYMLCVMF